MVRDPDQALVTVPIQLKEQAHGLPVGFTSGPSCSWRDRHRLLRNCWHRQVASFLFKLVLQHGVHRIESTAPGGEPKTHAAASTFEKALRAAREQSLPITRVRAPMGDDMYPAHDMWEHWCSSARVTPAALQPPTVEPSILHTLSRASEVRGHLPRHREVVIQGVAQLVAAMQSETDSWYEHCPAHVRGTAASR